MTEDIQTILEAAIAAPSLQNCQPWAWSVDGLSLNLFKVPVRDCASIDYAVAEAQYVALGAAIENACIAASRCGYRASVVYFPDPAQETLVATLALVKDPALRPDPLFAAIPLRRTNRKPYQSRPLTPEEEISLTEEGGEALKLLYDRDVIRTLARTAAMHKEIILTNQNEHYFLYSHISWNEDEERRKGTGFNLPTLESERYRLIFRLMGNWHTARALGPLIGRYARHVVRRAYEAAGAFGIITADGSSPEAYLEAGRRAERVWLAATALGLSLHPITGIIFGPLAASRRSGGYSPAQTSRLLQSYEIVRRLFGVEHSTVAFMFRVGHAEAPSGRSIRLPLSRVVEMV